MEHEGDWSLLEELDDEELISQQTAETVRNNARAGCLICALEDWDDE